MTYHSRTSGIDPATPRRGGRSRVHVETPSTVEDPPGKGTVSWSEYPSRRWKGRGSGLRRDTDSGSPSVPSPHRLQRKGSRYNESPLSLFQTESPVRDSWVSVGLGNEEREDRRGKRQRRDL